MFCTADVCLNVVYAYLMPVFRDDIVQLKVKNVHGWSELI